MKPLVVLFLLLIAAPANAGVVTITGDPCGDSLRVDADDARMSLVLRELADHAQFRLKFDPEVERDVSLHKQGSTQEILRSLLGGISLVMLEDTTPACGDRYVVSEAWILPRGENINYVDYVPPRPVTAGQSDTGSAQEGIPGRVRGLNREAKNKDELRALRRRAGKGELVPHPDTGEPMEREARDQLLLQRGELPPGYGDGADDVTVEDEE